MSVRPAADRAGITESVRRQAVSRRVLGPRLRRWRPAAAFTLIEVMLALAILSVALSTLLIARNRSITQLRAADEQVRLRAAASEALGQEVLATRFPESGSAATRQQFADIVTTARRSSEEYGDRVVLHRLEATARYRDRSDSPELTLATAEIEVIPSEDDDSPGQDGSPSPRATPRSR